MKNKLNVLKMQLLFGAVVALAVMLPAPAHAYIGPGAGFAFIGSAFVFLLTFVMAIATLAFWPVQWLWRAVAGKKISKNARTRRVVIVGLDGLEPKLVDQYMAEGKLPNLKALQAEGSFSRLGTTLPSLSPVAWSTFQTGVNPGAHNIFDFLTRDKRYCLPNLSSSEIDPVRRVVSIGRFSFPLGRAKIRLLRKSQPFWKILSRHGIFCNILRVPISYPPEKFRGNILSAMCTPDLRGTQGSFSFFTTAVKTEGEKTTGGDVQHVQREGDRIKGALEGPPHPFLRKGTPLKVPFTLTVFPERKEGLLEIGAERELLKVGEFSRWIEVTFKFGFAKSVSGICRFCLRSAAPEIVLYVSPININPEKPALPISHPVFLSNYLAKRQGPYGTLGLMEDTWGRNEQALDDDTFLKQTYLTHAERERMFFDALERTREGVCACVFDASDRIQHMFWRYLDEEHPAPKENVERFGKVIPEMYQRMDDLVGRVRAKVKEGDVLIVLSDHGFTSFRRGINLNTWLHQEGYLALKPSANGDGLNSDYFKNVDWSKTKAFQVGLAGIYLNRRGRELNGIVEAREADVLKREISTKLLAIRDPQGHKAPIRQVYDTAIAYRGVYRDEAPDLIVGCEPGYRLSWDSVTGGLRPELFEDNLKAWSGDHDVDPDMVPGILFSNRALKVKNPRIVDMAPTVLDLFAVPVPAYMEGRAVL
jgi:predicted AlkP superfamily phosphohydrolase/phosphomutase